MFPYFFKEVAAILTPRVCAVCRRLVQTGSLPVRWSNANMAAMSCAGQMRGTRYHMRTQACDVVLCFVFPVPYVSGHTEYAARRL